jgi:hypothetical protein
MRYHDGAWNGISPPADHEEPVDEWQLRRERRRHAHQGEEQLFAEHQRRALYTTPTLNAALPVGTVTRVLNLQTTATNVPPTGCRLRRHEGSDAAVLA